MLKLQGKQLTSQTFMIEQKEIKEIIIYEKNNIIAKYLIFHSELSYLNEITSSDEAYSQFESRYIEDFFYNLSGDDRWNLYFVFVLSDMDYKQLAWDKKVFIERKSDYARKTVIAASEYENNLEQRSDNETRNNKVLKSADPSKDWTTVLSENGMLLCVEEFTTKNFKLFLQGNKFTLKDKKNIKELGSTIKNKYANLKISNISFGTAYREHCFEPSTKLDFSHVNLLFGPNGSGKTSILEAIEIALTGNVHREQIGDAKKTNKVNSWDGIITFTNNLSISGLPSSEEKKLRESLFYENRERKIDKLNHAFHQYNYFSTEEVYQFCFTPEGQPDYENEFQKVIFGEEVKTIEKNINRHLEEVEDTIKGLNKNIDSHQKQILIYSELLRKNVSEINLSTVVRSLDNLYLRDDRYISQLSTFHNTHDNNLERLNELLEALHIEVDYFDQYAGELFEMKSLGIYTFVEAENKRTETKLNLNNIDQTLKNLRSTYTSLNEKIKSVTNKLMIRKEQQESENNNLINFNNRINYVNKNFIYFSNFNKVTERLEIESKYYELKKRYDYYVHFVSNYKIPEMVNIPIISTEKTEKKRIETENRLRKLNVQHEELLTAILKEENNNIQFKDQLKQLKVIGQTILETNRSIHSCPLCGVNHSSYNELLVNVLNGMEGLQLDTSLELKRKEFSLVAEIRETANELETIKKEDTLLNQITSSFGYLLKYNIADDFISSHINEQSNFRIIFNYVNKIIVDTKDILSELDYRIKSLESESYSYNSVVNFVQSFKQELGDSYIEGQIQIDQMLSNLNAKKAEFLNKVQESLSEMRKLEVELDLLQEEQMKVVDEGNKYRVQHEVYQNQLNVFSKWFVFKEILISKITYNSINDINLSSWASDLMEVKNEILLLKENIGNRKNYSEISVRMKDEERLIASDKELLKVCKKAKLVINKLNPLSDYSSEFLKNNISEISKKFVLLHSPREFSVLELNSNNKLIALRESSNKIEEVPIHLMSTGQRTAVALAVFFVLHISMKNAPKFILLDEPVSNMDDLNVLSFLDFIREISANGVQLFITTANPNIARLIRRKFSSLEDEFRSIKLSRTKNKKIHGEISFYTPHIEEPVKVDVM
ncbi:AAA family ATPase [Paenibacillus crassostreae]|uniref:Nuclease SbcCD subunit C n=1 Tax=Paenibacillus crassostreae TaxID=1763538 RepID=A0A167ADM4_9BACL|nr:AAA family ATPase [Paenibacillus crassostreae]AOZ92425.1 hypothetical protein LPB68_09390 [Paenibacillus crassostreae]OAB70887.1 hypothetical protein PNBC_21540 [Paenibacillus crassostreae]